MISRSTIEWKSCIVCRLQSSRVSVWFVSVQCAQHSSSNNLPSVWDLKHFCFYSDPSVQEFQLNRPSESCGAWPWRVIPKVQCVSFCACALFSFRLNRVPIVRGQTLATYSIQVKSKCLSLWFYYKQFGGGIQPLPLFFGTVILGGWIGLEFCFTATLAQFGRKIRAPICLLVCLSYFGR